MGHQARTLTPSELASTALPVLIQARDGKTAASLSEHGLFGAPTLNNTLQRFSTGFVRPADLARLVGAAQSVQLASAAAVPALAHTIAPVSAAAAPATTPRSAAQRVSRVVENCLTRSSKFFPSIW